MWRSVGRRVAQPFQGVARADARTIKIRLGCRGATPERRVYHFKFEDTLEIPFVNYSNVVSNVEKALLSRVYIPLSDWEPPACHTRVLRSAACRLGQQMEKMYTEEEVRDKVLKKFPPKKRQVYGDALSQKLDLTRHARVKAFVKNENVFFKESDKPRMIQFRDPVFLAHMLGAYKPLEHAFYHGRFLFNRHQKFTCAKGLSPLGRMKVIDQMVKSVEDPHVIDMDGSAFDAHVGPKALALEWKFYDMAWKEAGYSSEVRAELRAMGRAQLRNKCYSRCEDGVVKYTVDGNRMSGDLNTGNGNSVLQSIYIASAMMELRVPEAHWRMLVDGDDSIIVLSGKYVHLASELPALMSKFQQDVKMGKPTRVGPDSMEAITFCQSRPVLIDGKWRLVRDPHKVYNGYKMQTVWYRSVEESRRFFATVAGPEMIYARGTPVHSALFEMMHRLSGDAKPLDVISRKFWLRSCEGLESEIPTSAVTGATRESYFKAFGIAPLEQIRIETRLQSWTAEDLGASDLTRCYRDVVDSG